MQTGGRFGLFATQPLNLLDGQMYQSLQSLELARSCLDEHEAAAVAGWPVADTMQAFRLQQPSPRAMRSSGS